MCFLLRPVGRRDLSAGPEQKKKHHPGCFCFAPTPPIGRGRRSAIGSRRGAGAKKKHPGWYFFFLLWPRRQVSAARRGGVFFLLRPRPHRCGVFFLAAAPPGRSLTHCGLGRPFRQGPGGFFLLRPRRTRRANSKKCLAY